MSKDLSDWFKCSHCHEKKMSVKQVIGVGNYSLNLECPCGFRYVERDTSSDNWNREISIVQLIKRREAPQVSSKLLSLVECPHCNSDSVEVWLFSDNPGETIGHTRIDCQDCPEVLTKEISHG